MAACPKGAAGKDCRKAAKQKVKEMKQAHKASEASSTTEVTTTLSNTVPPTDVLGDGLKSSSQADALSGIAPSVVQDQAHAQAGGTGPAQAHEESTHTAVCVTPTAKVQVHDSPVASSPTLATCSVGEKWTQVAVLDNGWVRVKSQTGKGEGYTTVSGWAICEDETDVSGMSYDDADNYQDRANAEASGAVDPAGWPQQQPVQQQKAPRVVPAVNTEGSA